MPKLKTIFFKKFKSSFLEHLGFCLVSFMLIFLGELLFLGFPVHINYERFTIINSNDHFDNLDFKFWIVPTQYSSILTYSLIERGPYAILIQSNESNDFCKSFLIHSMFVIDQEKNITQVFDKKNLPIIAKFIKHPNPETSIWTATINSGYKLPINFRENSQISLKTEIELITDKEQKLLTLEKSFLAIKTSEWKLLPVLCLILGI